MTFFNGRLWAANKGGCGRPPLRRKTRKGYVYDSETQLYYLQSRYYDPSIGRFLNADALASTGQGLLGNNMFTYCLNNPVVCVDETGGAARSCLTADGRIDDAPWRNTSPSGGGIRSGNYSSGNDYGSVADKFYTVRLIKYITNTDEQVVLDARFLAFYKGVPVVKLGIGKEAFSYGIIFLGRDVTNINTVRHEYGHSLHFLQIGIKAYTATVFAPSLAGYWGGVEYGLYYSQPWEYIADVLGGVVREGYVYIPNAKEIAAGYWFFTIVVSGL